MTKKENGYLLIIGGAEDKKGESVILKYASGMVYDNEIFTIITTATEDPEIVGRDYESIFSRLGVKKIQVIDINNRDLANDEETCRKIKNSKCIFFTGGDQLRITSILGGTPACREIQDVYYNGGAIIGTSAGASVMSSTMIVQEEDYQSAKKCTTKMAPGLGLFPDTVIDQHFGQRGRFGRLLCSVAENPGALGIGIDEDTAIKVYPDMVFEVVGNNSVTVVDGTTIISSNVSELAPDEMLAINNVTVHALPTGYGFDIKKREVIRMKKDRE